MYWNPSTIFFHIPFLNLPVTWYGLLFAFGFWVGFHILVYMLKSSFNQKEANAFGERLLLYMVIATVIGARLGHIFFYEDAIEYFKHPLSILKTWEGGLASHGAIVAIVIATWFFAYRIKKDHPSFTFLRLLDHLAVPAMFAGAMIRIGNFFNQEILGTPTMLPWGVTFLSPADGGPIVPRHPAQLYEAAFYFALFLFLAYLWRKKLPSGRIAGLTLVLTFLFRFLIEFVKTEQSVWFEGSLLMGQILSLPILILGSVLLLYSFTERAKILRA